MSVKQMSVMSRCVGVAAVLALTAGLVSCGYSTKPLYQSSVRTVAVPVWGNKTFRTDLELKLTEAIKKNIEARTPYKVSGQDTADSLLTGEIVKIEEVVITRQTGINLPRETELTMVVDFTWKDLRTGRTIVKRASFSRSSTEIPIIGERITDTEQWAIERTAAGVVDQLQKDW